MFDGADVSSNIERFVPFDRTLAECRATRASTISLLDSLDEGDLDQMSASAPDGADNLFGTYRRLHLHEEG